MAIRVTHTPYEAIGQLAVQAGEAQQRVRQQEAERAQKYRLVLENMRQQNMMKRMQFQAEVDQARREKEWMMQSQLVNAKQQVAMQMEIQKFQMDRQKLVTTLNLIDDSNFLTPREKEKAKITAYSKWADADIPSGIFDKQVGGTPGLMGPEELNERQADISVEYARLQDAFDQRYDIVDDQIKVKFKKGAKTKRREPTQAEKAEAVWLMQRLRDLRGQSDKLSEATGTSPAETALELENLFKVSPNLRAIWQEAQQEGVTPQEFIEAYRFEQ